MRVAHPNGRQSQRHPYRSTLVVACENVLVLSPKHNNDEETLSGLLLIPEPAISTTTLNENDFGVGDTFPLRPCSARFRCPFSPLCSTKCGRNNGRKAGVRTRRERKRGKGSDLHFGFGFSPSTATHTRGKRQGRGRQ